jgi:phosphate-selective porin OprO and OprP
MNLHRPPAHRAPAPLDGQDPEPTDSRDLEAEERQASAGPPSAGLSDGSIPSLLGTPRGWALIALLLGSFLAGPARADQEVAVATPATSTPEPGAPPALPRPEPAPVVSPQLASLEDRLYALEQRARSAEARADLAAQQVQEVRAVRAVDASADDPVVGANDKGFVFRSADSSYALKLKGLVAFDGRKYLDDPAAVDGDGFLVRKIRPVFEVTVLKLADLRLNLDFAGGQVVVVDAYVDVKPTSWFKIRVGKLTPPVGLERLQQDAELAFIERALTGNLTAVRDVGVQLSVDLAGGFIHTDLGLFDGAPDNAMIDLDHNQGKDLAGRLWLQPLRLPSLAGSGELALGIAASTGTRKGQALRDRTALVPYRTGGQTVLFQYLTSDTVPADIVRAEGRHERLNPHLFFYRGGLGLVGEYSLSRQRLVKGTEAARLTHRAWHGTLSYVLGGKATLNGAVVGNPFDLDKGQLGALELAARYGEITFDRDSFPVFADPLRSARKARGLSGAASWYLSRNLRLSLNYEHTIFVAASEAGFGRPDEKVIFGRTQFVF